MLILVGSACSSRSGKRNENAVHDIIIFKSDITQNECIVSFTLVDTTGYVVKTREYSTTVMAISDVASNDELVLIKRAYLIVDSETVSYLKIE